jgi:SAM-dependent methyltransferase
MVASANPITSYIPAENVRKEDNKLRPEDRPAHDWYRFVLSFPPHLVRQYIERFGIHAGQLVLDPFCGTGTTLVECKKLGIRSVGIEANPIACFASQVKTDWTVKGASLLEHAREIAELALARLEDEGLEDEPKPPLFRIRRKTSPRLRTLPEETSKLLLSASISPLPLHKTLSLLGTMEERKEERFAGHERLALAKALLSGISNVEFGPEVGVGPAKADAPVISPWLRCVESVAEDLKKLRPQAAVPAKVYRADSRRLRGVLKPRSVDTVITSPPYPNEKDYTRTTRLESVLLGFIRDKQDLRMLKSHLVRSNTRNVYKGDCDDEAVAENKEVQQIAAAIEKRRKELGKTSGFERLYARVTKLYFGGMARHLSELREILRPGAHLAYVVGDQASYLRIMIRTGQLLANIAASLGYEVLGVDLFRTRLATATREQLREEILLLRWPR